MKSQSKTVCVIGGGASGITTVKQLLDEGHIPVCYEKTPDLGGVFNYANITQSEVNGVYKNTVLTISNYLMGYSDMPPTGHRRHWHHEEYKRYLFDYIDKYRLAKYIKCSHAIEKVAPLDKGHGGYRVSVRNDQGKIISERYDAVVICTGTHQLPSFPEVAGLDDFKGEVIHSSVYDDDSIAEGKNVLCVGLGESSADITREVSERANNCYLGLRSYPFLIPRNLENSSSDGWTSRLHHDYHTPRKESLFSYLMLLFYIVFFKRSLLRRKGLKKDSFMQDASSNMMDMNTPGSVEGVKLVKAWNYLSKGRKFATKNVTFVPNVLNGKIKVNASGLKAFTENEVVFNDGERREIDMVIFNTGYHEDFSIIDGYSIKDNNVRNMFMNAFPTDLPNCAFIGWARPVTGGVPATSEMAARYFALILSGKRSLPQDVDARIEEDKKFYLNYYSRNSQHVHTVVAWKRYLDTLSELIGCQVKPMKYILRPKLFVRLFAGSLVPYQYRLDGPHARRDEAIRAIEGLEVTLPLNHIYYGIKANMKNKIRFMKDRKIRQRETVEYSQFFSEWFRFDVELTVDDVKKYAFRKDGLTANMSELH